MSSPPCPCHWCPARPCSALHPGAPLRKRRQRGRGRIRQKGGFANRPHAKGHAAGGVYRHAESAQRLELSMRLSQAKRVDRPLTVGQSLILRWRTSTAPDRPNDLPSSEMCAARLPLLWPAPPPSKGSAQLGSARLVTVFARCAAGRKIRELIGDDGKVYFYVSPYLRALQTLLCIGKCAPAGPRGPALALASALRPTPWHPHSVTHSPGPLPHPRRLRSAASCQLRIAASTSCIAALLL